LELLNPSTLSSVDNAWIAVIDLAQFNVPGRSRESIFDFFVDRIEFVVELFVVFELISQAVS
jgi:hypothetical protein